MGDTTLQTSKETPQVWLTLPGMVSRPAHRRRGAIQRNVRLDHMPTYRLPERECHAEHTPPLPATDEAECPWPLAITGPATPPSCRWYRVTPCAPSSPGVGRRKGRPPRPSRLPETATAFASRCDPTLGNTPAPLCHTSSMMAICRGLGLRLVSYTTPALSH